MYYEYYGFAEPPFSLTPDPKYLFFSEQHREALDHLVFGVRERKGFIQITGEVGAGKTTLCRAFFNELDDHWLTALVLNPMLSADELIRVILRELRIADTTDRVENFDRLNQFLLAKTREHRDVVLVIDEAQTLTAEMLEQVRLISNLETDNQKLIQIVLLGQPELRDKLESPDLRQLRQRITIRYHLGPLSAAETRRYLEHRMSVAGGRGTPQFGDGAVRAIHGYAGGIPRMINAVADKALLAGFVFKTATITKQLVRLAAQELEGHFE
ncbi:MAG: hypothetical protein BWZ02_00641 [Lentisphaerae bacterium ADurb.BinA184]|nr:MAG: hypothetical protein BWZ02_00641 [Lentisphaerae bacterium ADurb.BinA184]